MDKEWILAFAFFMLFNNSPEVMSLLNSDNFEEDFCKGVNELENIDSEELKKLVVNKVKESHNQFEALNEAYKHRKDEELKKYFPADID